MASSVFRVELLVVDVLQSDFSNFCLYDQQIYLRILSSLRTGSQLQTRHPIVPPSYAHVKIYALPLRNQ